MSRWQVFEKCYFLSLLRVRKHFPCIKWPFLLFVLRIYIFNRKARDLVLAIIANTLVKDIVMDTGCMLKWHESSVMVLLWICYGGKQRPTNPNRHTTVQKVQEMGQMKIYNIYFTSLYMHGQDLTGHWGTIILQAMLAGLLQKEMVHCDIFAKGPNHPC